MDRIEKVIQILVKARHEGKNLGMVMARKDIAKEIDKVYNEPRSDQSGLLTETEADGIIGATPQVHYNFLVPYLEAQRDLTVLITKDEQGKRCADEKAEFGLSVHEAAVAMRDTHIEAWVEWLEKHKRHYQPSNRGTEYYISYEDLIKFKANPTSEIEG